MTTYTSEVLLRGTPDHGLKIKGCHLIQSTVVNGRDYPGDPVPINFADLDGLLPEWFSGLAGQVAAAEAARDVALADKAAVEQDRDQKVAASDAAKAAAEARAVELQAQIDALTAPPAYITLSDRQFFQALALNELITQDEALAAVATGTIPPAMAALVDHLPADQQFGARMLLKGATAFRSDHPLTDALASLYDWSPEQKLALFQAASQL